MSRRREDPDVDVSDHAVLNAQRAWFLLPADGLTGLLVAESVGRASGENMLQRWWSPQECSQCLLRCEGSKAERLVGVPVVLLPCHRGLRRGFGGVKESLPTPPTRRSHDLLAAAWPAYLPAAVSTIPTASVVGREAKPQRVRDRRPLAG